MQRLYSTGVPVYSAAPQSLLRIPFGEKQTEAAVL